MEKRNLEEDKKYLQIFAYILDSSEIGDYAKIHGVVMDILEIFKDMENEVVVYKTDYPYSTYVIAKINKGKLEDFIMTNDYIQDLFLL